MTKAKSLIPLNQTPEHFFDQEKWQQFVTLSKSRGGALNNLTNPGYRIRRSDIEDSQSETSQIIRLRDELLDDLTRKLIGGEITAEGILYPTTTPSEIPVAIWEQNIAFNFDTNKVVSGKYEFIGIQLFKVGNEQKPARTLVDECTTWLHDNIERHMGWIKTAISDDALGHFGKNLKTRTFDEAYQMVYERSRGRPRKPRK